MLKSLPLARGEHLLDTRISGLRVLLRTHNNFADRALPGVSFKFLTYQLVGSVLDYRGVDG